MSASGHSVHWYDRLLGIDRRWIYALVGAAVVLPTLMTFRVPTGVSSETRAVYDFVASLQPGDVLYVGIDYDPSSLAELHPMTEAILRQAWDRNAKILAGCLPPYGVAMAQELLERVAKEKGKEKGIDWVYLGYKPYPALVIAGMGADFRVPYPSDHYGTPLDSIPMMQDIRNYRSVKGVISMGAGVADTWIQYGQAKYNFKLAIGVTGVMASDYYPYLQSGQIFGLIPGVKGAAEYEQLLGIENGAGSRGMPYQVTTHAVILAVIVVANIGYIARRRARGRAAERRD